MLNLCHLASSAIVPGEIIWLNKRSIKYYWPYDSQRKRLNSTIKSCSNRNIPCGGEKEYNIEYIYIHLKGKHNYMVFGLSSFLLWHFKQYRLNYIWSWSSKHFTLQYEWYLVYLLFCVGTLNNNHLNYLYDHGKVNFILLCNTKTCTCYFKIRYSGAILSSFTVIYIF